MNFKRFHESKNLFDKSTITTSAYAMTTGTRENASHYCSDFIPITATTYYFQNVVGQSFQNSVVVYDANKQGLRYERLIGRETASGALTFIEGDAYIRINCYNTTDVDTVMVNKGSTPQPYEPYSSEVWHDIPYYIHKSATDTLTLPAVIYPNDTSITVDIKGNTTQSGTPTPTTPITPSECGDRTANLFDYVSYFQTIQPWSETSAGDYFDYGILHLSPNTTYTFSTNFHTGISGSQQNVRDVPFIAVNSNTNPSTAVGGFGDDGSVSVTTLSDGIIRLFKRIQRGSPTTDLADLPTLSDFQNGKWVMCNVGSEALPYEPYGIKIPISSGGENLFDENYPSISPTIQYTPIFVGDGTFTLSTTTPQMSNGAACLFLIGGNVSSGAGPQNKVYNEQSVTVDSSNGYITIAYRMVSDYDPRNYEAMLNRGSTALPYEPYIEPTETNIYLGEVQTVRQIKKLVLTGEEAWAVWSSGQPDVERYYYKWGKTTPSDYSIICTHFPLSKGDGNFNHIRLGGSSLEDFIIFISKTIAPTVADFKSYLAAQYAAGTPVTIWYVLATPETAVVNEPLMKIDTYADSLTTSIPCTAGENTLDVQTTVAPSEVSAGFSGWHPVNSAHERENGQWD